MIINHQPKTELEHIALAAIDEITKTYKQTFFVGGYVRDILLNTRNYDIDIATEATPDEIVQILTPLFVCNSEYKNFGIISIHEHIEIATFRTEKYDKSRYPKIEFTNSIEQDSARRDFTINSLYMSKEGQIYDYQGGMADLGKGIIKFIGEPNKRLTEDPIRLVRAIRFMLQLEFKIDYETAVAIQNNFDLLKNIKSKFISAEQNKLNKNLQKQFEIIINRKVLDESFINSYNDVV